MVNVKEHNEMVAKIEALKPVLPKKIRVKRKNVELVLSKKETGILDDFWYYQGSNCCFRHNLEQLKELAALILTITGPLTPEELDAVVIE